MAGIRVQVIKADFDKIATRLQQIARKTGEPQALTEALGQLLETQTKRRISDEKTKPDGGAWDAWSSEYALTRAPKHSLLVNDQNLLDSIAGSSTKTQAVVGSDMVYAAVHQYGHRFARGQTVPARPYLGLSAANLREIETTVDEWFQEVFR